MAMTKIYGLADPRTGQLRYVGKTTQSLKERLSGHIETRNRAFYNARWVRSLYDKGLRPEIFLIEEVAGDGCESEVHHIAYFKSVGCSLTNATSGGEGWIPSAEVREKLRRASTGRVTSEETKQKQRIANLGKKMSPEAVAKTRAALLGRKFSNATLERMRAAASSRSPETRAKISAAAKGHKRWLGKRHTSEAKTRISKAARARHLFSVLVRTAVSRVSL